MRNKEFKRKAYLHGIEPFLLAELEQEREYQPIYATCDMPVVAVAGAVMSGIAGVGMVTAATATTLSTIIGGALIVGSALTIVGTISGNEELANIGSLVSTVAGVSGFAAGAMGGLGTTPEGANYTITDAFNDGLNSISDAFGSLTGSGTAATNAAHTELVQPVEIGGASDDLPATFLEDMPQDVPVDDRATFLEDIDSGSITKEATKNDSGGILNNMLKGLGGDGDGMGTIIGNTLSGMAQGAGSYLSAQAEAEALEKARKNDIKMASNGPLIINPNSPNAAEWEAYAAQYGHDVIQFGVNPDAKGFNQPSYATNPATAQYTTGQPVITVPQPVPAQSQKLAAPAPVKPVVPKA